MKKIGLIDADLMDNGTRHPNLALMKIAGYYKELGCEVKLIYKSYDEIENYDEIFLSKVFNFTHVPKWVMSMPNVKYGGTGFFEDGGENLPDEIEHHMPYYDLYKEYVDEQLGLGRKRIDLSDYIDYSIGFTTRGCFRKCSFCVNKKYNKVKEHSPVREFFDENRPYIYLWDDNILAYPHWEKILDDIESTGRQFQFRQGIDLRLMTDKKAKRFNSTSYKGDFIFAFDSLSDSQLISEKVQLWKRYSSKVCKMYVLCAYDSQDEKDIESVFERIKILMRYGSLPYIMRYEAFKQSKFKNMYIELARWCNQPQFFKKKSFREFCEANQAYKKNQNTYCSSYKAMLDFEKEYPEIAKKYFDLKFEKENIYKLQYGYGRKYENKPLCRDCKKQGLCWEEIIHNKGNEKIEKEFIDLYFNKEIDLLCLNYMNSECGNLSKEAALYVKDILLKYKVEEIVEILRLGKNREQINMNNVPQVDNFEDATNNIVNILMNPIKDNLKFEDIGYNLKLNYEPNKIKESTLRKYGQNHTRLATLMDLTHIGKVGSNSYIYLTELGRLFYKLNNDEKKELSCKLLLRIPIISNSLINNDMDITEVDMQLIPKNIRKKVKSSVNILLDIIKEECNKLV